ncbi:MAG: DUF4325 domain-containing protein [Gammaproteobacteria bacterium]
MTRVRTRGEKIRQFIVAHVEKHPNDIAKITAREFEISRQAVNKHLRRLVLENALDAKGVTRNLSYHLHPLEDWQQSYSFTPELAEDIVWRNDIAPRLGELPDNVVDIWRYGFTEMFNNAIDHSAGSVIQVNLRKTATTSELAIFDDGIGIFKKIQRALDLLDERHAVLELSKGKLTTDPANHTGEGIFFTSRMFDNFKILSGGIFFSHDFGHEEDWILEGSRAAAGTAVWMKISNHTARTTKKVFDQFTSDDDIGFSKTVVPVRLAQYGDDKLVSRSQAKRLLARVDRFRTVIFDFNLVESIGQAFADEIFRVFSKKHPEMSLLHSNANKEVEAMINRAHLNDGALGLEDL